MVLYLNAEEQFKKEPYDVWVPAYYSPHMPRELIEPMIPKREKANPRYKTPINFRNPTPFRSLDEPNKLELAAFSLEIIVEMFTKQIEFTLMREDDVPKIMDALDRYLLHIENHVRQGVQEFVDYARLVIAFREAHYLHYFRFMKTHPAAERALHIGGDPSKNILYLLSVANRTKVESRSLDPLLARREPPYQIDRITPRSDAASSVDDMDRFGGMAADDTPLGAVTKFDMDDFLKRT